MNYTTNYKLPKWVEDDRIMMKDFNDAMENVDKGIAAAKTAADSAQAAAAEGISKADAAQAAADKNCMVKLAEGALTANSSSISIDLSGTEMSRFSKLVLYINAYTTNSASVIGVRFNNISSATYTSDSSGGLTSMWLNNGDQDCIIEAHMMPYQNQIISLNRTGNMLTQCKATACKLDKITSMQILLFHTGGTILTFSGGSTYSLYGLK